MAGRRGDAKQREPRRHSCGELLERVEAYEVIPAGGWQWHGGRTAQFRPVVGAEDPERVILEYRCLQCGGLLDEKEGRWLESLQQEEHE